MIPAWAVYILIGAFIVALFALIFTADRVIQDLRRRLFEEQFKRWPW